MTVTSRMILNLLVAIASHGSTAIAQPTYDPPWSTIELHSEGTTAGEGKGWLRDSEDEQLIWLLPPSHGAIDPEPQTMLPETEYCAELKATLRNLSASSEEFSDYVNYIVAAMPRIRQVTARFQHSSTAIKAWQQRSPVHQKMSRYWHAQQHAQRELYYIAEKEQLCDRYCLDWQHDSAIAHTKLTDARQSLKAFERSHPTPYRQLAKLDKAQQQAVKEHLDLSAQLSGYRRHIAELETLLTRSYRRLANKPAGELAVRYLPGHRALLTRWQSSNPGYRFKVVPMSHKKLFARLVPTKIDDYYLASIPAFLGFKAKGFPRLKAGQWHQHSSKEELPETLKGIFYLSLHGACALTDANFFRDKGLHIERREGKQPLPRFAAVLMYHYPVTIGQQVTVTFDAAAIYDALMGQNLAGGIATSEHIAKALAADTLRPLVQFSGAPLPSRRRDMIIASIAYQILGIMTDPTLTLAGDLTSPFALTPGEDDPPLGRASGGWRPFTGKAFTQAYKRLKALPRQVRHLGPNQPLLVPGMTQFDHFRMDGL